MNKTIPSYNVKLDDKFYTLIEDHYFKNNVLPVKENLYRAFKLTPIDKVKVVILGQDPYPNREDATGLAFSVSPNSKIPKSLVNMYKELESDIGVKRENGNLEDWAEQGVLLMNTTLTVVEGSSNSDQKIGWENYTDQVIKKINEEKEHIVFILLGNHAQKKEKLINSSKHLIIKTAHPSPLGAYRGFWGSKIYSRTNDYLSQYGVDAIKW